MASHLSSLGINVKDKNEFIELFKKANEKGEHISTKSGKYVKWEMGDGVELWGQIDNSGNPIGLNPHFSGESVMKVRIVDLVKNEDDTILDGAIHCWAEPVEGESDGIYPFLFDSPDFDMYQDIKCPQVVSVKVTGIAHEISTYENEKEFDQLQNSESKFASESFIPIGLFSENNDGKSTLEAMALFTGYVLETKIIRNSYTNIQIHWARIKTLGGELDIIVDPEILNGEIVVNGIVSGTFWLTGRIISDFSKNEKKKTKFSLRRLFGEK